MIVMLCGKSCVGKDSIRELLITDKGYKGLISYTTRPKRDYEIDGVDYYFINKDEMNEMLEKGEILDYREYKVSGGEIWGYGHNYKNIDEIDDDEVYVGIGDLGGCKRFKEKYNDNCLIIYIEAPYYQRRVRANIRNDNTLEIQRRFTQDDIDFSNEKLYNIIDYSVENSDGYMGKTVDEIAKYIERTRYEHKNKHS